MMMFVSVIKNTAATLFPRSGFLGAKSNFKILQYLPESLAPTLRISRNLEIDKKVLSSGSAFGLFCLREKPVRIRCKTEKRHQLLMKSKLFKIVGGGYAKKKEKSHIAAFS